MAKTIGKRQVKSSKKMRVSPFSIYWGKENYFLLAAGIVLLILGYFIMSLGEWNSSTALVISPIILFIAYILVFPASILRRRTVTEEKTEE